MPIYEYEHEFDECELCDFRFGVVQAVGEKPLEFCPSCGLKVKRVVSLVRVLKSRPMSASRAAKAGFTTWKKSGPGEWEKLDEPGIDAIVGSEEDKRAIADEKIPKFDLDSK